MKVVKAYWDSYINSLTLVLGRRPKPKNDRQKQKRKHNSTEGGRSEMNKDGPRKKQAVEKTPFVPRVVCKFWEGGYCSNVSISAR